MKFRQDFVTNSSSTCWVLFGKATFEHNGEQHEIEKYVDNCSTVDMVKMIEGEIQHVKQIISNNLKITFNQEVYDMPGDGWDGGDYTFAGPGWRFFGRSDIAEATMTKENVELTYCNGKITFPVEWIHENDPDTVLANNDISREDIIEY